MTEKTTIQTRHYHVTVGPPRVNLFNIRGLTFAGPYYDIIIKDVEQAVKTWAGLANQIIQHDFFKHETIEPDEIQELIDDISAAEWSFDYEADSNHVGFEIGDGGCMITFGDCGSCKPVGTN